jgi:hypothetical protein
MVVERLLHDAIGIALKKALPFLEAAALKFALAATECF